MVFQFLGVSWRRWWDDSFLYGGWGAGSARLRETNCWLCRKSNSSPVVVRVLPLLSDYLLRGVIRRLAAAA